VGAKTKGGARPTSIATTVSMVKGIAASASKEATMNAIVSLAAAAFPHYATIIFAVYVGLRYTWRAIQAYREYEKLRKEMAQQRALRVQAEKEAFREGAGATTRTLDPDVKSRIEDQIAVLLARPEVNEAIEGGFGKHLSEHTKDRFRMMLQATASQFLIGAIAGGKGKVVDDASRVFFR
jgi:hypothetical protein